MSGSLLLAAIAVWFAAGAVLSYFARSAAGAGRGMSGFFLANRGIGGVVSAMTYSATTYSAFMMVGLVGITYRSGVASLGFLAGQGFRIGLPGQAFEPPDALGQHLGQRLGGHTIFTSHRRHDLDALVGKIASEARAGDHILVMSNGGFGGIHGKLLAALADA